VKYVLLPIYLLACTTHSSHKMNVNVNVNMTSNNDNASSASISNMLDELDATGNENTDPLFLLDYSSMAGSGGGGGSGGDGDGWSNLILAYYE
jgi:hypothetical protein